MGVFETDGAAYGLYGDQAELIATYVGRGGEGTDDFDRLRTSDRPNLRGNRRYVASARHANYVKGNVFAKALREATKRLARIGSSKGLK